MRLALSEGRRAILFVRQLVDGVLVVSKVDGGHPVEVLRADGVDVHRELDTAVGDLTHIGVDLAEGIDDGRDGVGPDEVLRLLVVKLDATIDAVMPECIVETKVEHGCRLPLQVGVSQFRGTQDGP